MGKRVVGEGPLGESLYANARAACAQPAPLPDALLLPRNRGVAQRPPAGQSVLLLLNMQDRQESTAFH